MTSNTCETLALFIEQHAIAAVLVRPDRETPTVALAALALDCRTDQIVKSVLFLLRDGQQSTPVLVITNPAPVCDPLSVDLTLGAVTAGSTLYGATLSYWEDVDATTPLANPGFVSVSGTYYIKATTTEGCYDIKPRS